MPNNLIFQYFNAHRDLLLRVKNTVNGNVISQYNYTNDALGRRSSMTKSGSMTREFAEPETLNYAYNARSELTGAVSSADSAYNYAYAFDNIGNRATASEAGTQTNYATNALNQYALIDDFVPAYDADGNATQIKTSTGTWTISYNGANRPVTWVKSTGEKIFMMYDSLGRRFEKRVLNAAGRRILRERYVYAGYNCVQILNGDGGNAVEKEFVWDPTEPTGTRPLTWTFVKRGLNLFYAHDGNKNVSDVFFLATQNGIAAHYEYSPFGEITRTAKNTPYTINLIAENPFRFSSEFYDPELDLIYYNYRHYSPALGRWLSRDPIEEKGGLNLYAFCKNNGIVNIDLRGNILPCDIYEKVRKRSDGKSEGRSSCSTRKPPKTNGCGAESGVLNTGLDPVPDSYFDSVFFTQACNSHDKCYGGFCHPIPERKELCDAGLKFGMENLCKQALREGKISHIDFNFCMKQANIYYHAVLNLAEGAFEEAQDEACIWNECCPC